MLDVRAFTATMPAMRQRLLCAALVLGACSTPDAPQQEPARAPELPWTQEFMEEATLVADEVAVEGPPGLLHHFVQRQEPDWHDYSVRTVPEGLLQETRLRVEGGPEIRANLDNLAIVALRSLRVLERPGDVPVTVRARGDAYWQRTKDGSEQRSDVLELVGQRPH